MKILYLNPDRGIPVLGDKGASVHVREFVTAVASQGHEVGLVCANLGEGNAPPPARIIELPALALEADLARESLAQGLPASAAEQPVLRRELARLCYERSFCGRVIEALDQAGFRPDMIYERYALFHREGVSLARALGVPRLLEVNAPLIREQEQFRGLVLKSVATAAERASFHGADAVVAVSEEVAAYVASCGVRQDRVMVIPNGVDTQRFHPEAGAQAVRRKFGLGAAPVIGFIGSFKPWHGVGFLIDAFAVLAKLHPRARLLLVGEGPELEASRQAVEELGLRDRAVFTGRVPHVDIPAYLAAMDISAAPYLPERDFYFSPLKVVEALSAGSPVLASRIGQLESLVEDGSTGLLFTPGDQDDFVAKALDMLCNGPRRRLMSAAARRQAVSHFSWSAAVGRALDEGQRLIEEQRAA